MRKAILILALVVTVLITRITIADVTNGVASFANTPFSFLAAAGVINNQTADGADTGSISIFPSNATGPTRSGTITAYGDNHASFPGWIRILTSSASGTKLYFESSASNGQALFNVNGADRWQLDSNGNWNQDPSSGKSIVMQRNGSYLQQSIVRTAAAGSSITDATQLTRVYNQITTVGSGQGVKLPDVTGVPIVVQNFGANNLLLYPPDGSSALNAATAGNPITLTTATDDVATCTKVGGSNWVCPVSPGPAA